MMLNVHGSRSVISHYDSKESPYCQMCDATAVETVSHVLFKCDEERMSICRNKLWNEVMKSCSQSLKDELQNMSSDEKTVFLLTGLNSGYISEWAELFSSIKNFLLGLYWLRIKS